MKFELNDKKLDAIKADFELVFIQDKKFKKFLTKKKIFLNLIITKAKVHY